MIDKARRQTRRIASTPWAILIVLLLGCSTEGLVPASGSVTLDDKALRGASLLLIPESGGLPAVAFTDDAGDFSLSTGNGIGAKPGRYVVTVSKDELVSVKPSGDKSAADAAITNTSGKTIDELSDAELGEVMTQLTPTPRALVTPTRYASAEQSPLRCEIPRNGSQALHFNLVSER